MPEAARSLGAPVNRPGGVPGEWEDPSDPPSRPGRSSRRRAVASGGGRRPRRLTSVTVEVPESAPGSTWSPGASTYCPMVYPGR